MNSIEFLRPRLTGARFEGHAIPLELLKDLAVLEEMIVEVAKWKYLQDHPGRSRSPRGFTEGIELRLTGIEEGSAIPVISLLVAMLGLLPPENQVYFEHARDAVIDAIGAAETNKSITEYLPEFSLAYFDRMGRGLRDGEAMEFTSGSRPTPAKLTKETRRKLVLASSHVKEMTEETTVRGTVPEADQDKMTFQVQLPDGRKIVAPMSTQHLDDVLEAFTGYQSGTRVLLQGVGRFDRNERLRGVDSIEHICILDALDIPARLDELRLLKDGWLEGQGIVPSHGGLDWFEQTFRQNYPDELPLPFLYPTAEGGIQAEWSLGSNEITLVVDLSTHAGRWHALNMGPDSKELEKLLSLDDPGDWGWLVAQIEPMRPDAV